VPEGVKRPEETKSGAQRQQSFQALGLKKKAQRALKKIRVASGAMARSDGVPVDSRQAQRVSASTTADLTDTTSGIGVSSRFLWITRRLSK